MRAKISKKIFISPERRQKPHGPYAVGKVFEHDICNEIGRLLKRELEDNGFYVIIRTEDKGNDTMALRVAEANKGGYHYYIAIHSNGGGGTGAECLHDGSVNGKKANQLVYNELTELHPSKRGIKDYSHFYENKYTKMVSCYSELGFHDNIKDAQFILDNKMALAIALCKGICAYFGTDYKKNGSMSKDDLGETAIGTDKWVENQDIAVARANSKPDKSLYMVQTGAFRDKENAKRLSQELQQLGYESLIKCS